MFLKLQVFKRHKAWQKAKSEVSLQQLLLSAAKAIFNTFGAREQLPAPQYLYFLR